MAYVHCVPARVVQMRHGLDNVVTGVLRTHDDEFPFRTRGHVVKATNRIYRNCSWKPSAGTDVLVDGDVLAAGMVVDHVEPDLMDGDACGHEHLDALALLLPTHPVASATLRVCRTGAPFRLRFAKAITGEGKRGVRRPGILHASFDPEGALWRVWTVAQDGAVLAGRGLDQHALPAIAAEIGVEIAAPKVGEDYEKAVRPAARKPIYEPPPFDDVPF